MGGITVKTGGGGSIWSIVFKANVVFLTIFIPKSSVLLWFCWNIHESIAILKKVPPKRYFFKFALILCVLHSCILRQFRGALLGWLWKWMGRGGLLGKFKGGTFGSNLGKRLLTKMPPSFSYFSSLKKKTYKKYNKTTNHTKKFFFFLCFFETKAK